jgi:Putative prokaryotic signal transducing protein
MTRQPTNEPVTIRTCRDIQEAQILRSMLEAGGIKAFIPDENAAGLYPPQVLDTNGVRVQVRPEDLDLARELLEHEE